MKASSPAARGLARWAGLGGVVYAILFVVGFIVAFHGQPDTSDAAARLVAYYGKGSHRSSIHLGIFLIIIGVFFFIWFVGALRHVVRALAGDGLLTFVTTVGGAVY